MRNIGELLPEEGIITPKQLQKALEEQRGSTEKLGTIYYTVFFPPRREKGKNR